MNIWLLTYRFATLLCAAMVVAAGVSLFLPKLRQNQERQRRVMALEQDNRAREDQIKHVQALQDQFLSDPRAVERVAREELGKARAGETIFRFPDQKTNAYRPRP